MRERREGLGDLHMSKIHTLIARNLERSRAQIKRIHHFLRIPQGKLRLG